MDLLTQLDQDVDLLLKIMSSSIAYISRKAKHQPLPESSVPLTILGKTEAIEPDEMKESIQELVQDLVHKAQEIQQIILHLPSEELGQEDQLKKDLTSLEHEMRIANAEYKQAVKQAQDLHKEIKSLLDQLCDHQQGLRTWLASSLTHSSPSVTPV